MTLHSPRYRCQRSGCRCRDRKKDLIITGGKNVRPGDIEGLVYSALSVDLDDFRIVEPGWIVKTTTKKISRKKTGEKYRRHFI